HAMHALEALAELHRQHVRLACGGLRIAVEDAECGGDARHGVAGRGVHGGGGGRGRGGGHPPPRSRGRRGGGRRAGARGAGRGGGGGRGRGGGGARGRGVARGGRHEAPSQDAVAALLVRTEPRHDEIVPEERHRRRVLVARRGVHLELPSARAAVAREV